MAITIKDRRTARRIAVATKRVEAMPVPVNGRGAKDAPAPVDAEWWAEITGQNTTTGLYSWRRVKSNGTGGLTDAEVLIATDNAAELPGPTGLPTGHMVRLRYAGIDGDDPTKPRYLIAGHGGLFPIKLYKTSGSAGTKTTQCSWVYTAKTRHGFVLGTGLTPLKLRPNVGPLLAPADGSWGIGFYDDGGTFRLYDANEALDAGSC